ncbi:SPOR domain-containing protein [Mariprofundus ferrooxydans]|nr:SPOR domain-containing protein [Mariprofundus ferrooxydans]
MTGSDDVKKSDALSAGGDLAEESVLDSDELFDLDMALDEMLPNLDQDQPASTDRRDSSVGDADNNELSGLSMEDALDLEAEDPLDLDAPLARTGFNDPENSANSPAEEADKLYSDFDGPIISDSDDVSNPEGSDDTSAQDSAVDVSDIENDMARDTTEPRPQSQYFAAEPDTESGQKSVDSGDHASYPGNGKKSLPKAETNPDGANKVKLENMMTYILGGALALMAGGATWIASTALDRVAQIERNTLPVVQENREGGQNRGERLGAVEAQTQTYEQRIDALEQQVHTLTMVISNSASKNWKDTLEPAAENAAPSPAPAESTTTPVNALTTPVTTAKPVPKAKTKTAPPTTNDNGKWAVNLTSYESQKAAELEVANFRKEGIKAEYIRIQIKGKIWYRLRVAGFTTEHDAVAYEKYLKEFKGINAWHRKME